VIALIVTAFVRVRVTTAAVITVGIGGEESRFPDSDGLFVTS
jgi:hypothetical protein